MHLLTLLGNEVGQTSLNALRLSHLAKDTVHGFPIGQEMSHWPQHEAKAERNPAAEEYAKEGWALVIAN